MALLVSAAPASASTNTPTLHPFLSASASDCTESIVFVERPVSELRQFVPEAFTPLPGQADGSPNLLVDGVIDCRQGVADDLSEPGGPFDTSGVLFSDPGILIESPDGSPGLHYYMPWILANEADSLIPTRKLGVTSGLVSDMRQTATDGPVRHLEASLPWDVSPYSLTVDAGSPFVTSSTLNFWATGPKGIMRMLLELDYQSVMIGTGSVEAAPNTPMAQMLGGARDGIGVALAYSYDATFSAEKAALRTPIRLRARPRVVRAGERTRFRFRARTTTLSGTRTPVSGAEIRFGGRTARTNERGEAVMKRRLSEGKHRAIVRKPGLKSDSVRVVVRIDDR